MITEYPFIDSCRTKSGSHRGILKYLVKEFKVCYHCGVNVFYAAEKHGQKPPRNSATIDHLVSRFFREKGEKVPKVLSCHSCNQKRSHVEVLDNNIKKRALLF